MEAFCTFHACPHNKDLHCQLDHEPTAAECYFEAMAAEDELAELQPKPKELTHA